MKRAVDVGLALCGLVIVATVVLVGVRVVAGPRTVHHDKVPCPAGSTETTCTEERHTGSLVGRSWLVALLTVSVCAGAVGLTLRAERTRLSGG